MNSVITINGEEVMAAVNTAAKKIELYADSVDKNGVFPLESIGVLRESGLMGILIPEQHGGFGASLSQFSDACRMIAGACLSTGMIWSMHVQQSVLLAEYGSDSLKKRLLPQIAGGEAYIVSVTSDVNTGSQAFNTNSVLEIIEDYASIVRHAPTATGAEYGDGFLITMKEHRENSNLLFVYAEKQQISLQLNSGWSSMGMRGTQSCAISIDGKVPVDQIISPETARFEEINQRVMAPVGHIAWASCWLGAVKEVYKKMVKTFRHPDHRKRFSLQSESFLEKLAKIRQKIDVVETYLNSYIRDYTEMLSSQNESSQAFASTAFKMKTNNLKIVASDYLFEAVNQLIDISGLAFGYLKNDHVPLERVFRDIRSASMMINNQKLLLVNGTLALIER
ncbi:acyl-CoA dehydrogenase family protein [Paenibacillus sp. GCM10027627]|uniref:acyl-CoA dehydrogenase family protein n=1 Tax=unclassified Paenibacillus TaxID=185978 RepID=UPI003627F828